MAGDIASGNPPGIHRAANADALRERRLRALELRIKGWTIAAIVREVGVTGKRVRMDIEVVLAERESLVVEKGRKLADAHLDALTMKAWEVLDGADSGELRLKAIDRLVRIEERRSKLHGYDAPVRADLTVYEQTEQDRELQEMLRTAQARSAVLEGQITAATTEETNDGS